MYDYSKLRGRIVEKCGTISNLSDRLGTSIVIVSNKLNNKSGFSREDMEKWAEILEIPGDEFHAYFFTRKVQQG